LAAVLPGCATHAPPKTAASPPSLTNADVQSALRIGDKTRVELTGIPDPPIAPIEQDIKDDGSITLPYIGRVMAAGKTPVELEKEIYSLYVPTWYKHISVTVTPTARFFYVGGQVNNLSGGRIMYTGPITVMGAIQAAGDFTPFADKRHVQVTRVDGTIEHVNCVKVIKNPKLDLQVFPGDRIYVPLRKF
jgi:polysaccharide export outer membrane protein